MPSLFKHRRHRFDALHALLTGAVRPSGHAVPPNLRRDVGLPDSLDPRVPPLLDPAFGPLNRRT